MEKKLIQKMIRNCFQQYEYENGFIPLNEEENKKITEKVLAQKQTNNETDLYELVQDVVYEYLTN